MFVCPVCVEFFLGDLRIAVLHDCELEYPLFDGSHSNRDALDFGGVFDEIDFVGFSSRIENAKLEEIDFATKHPR